MKINRLKSAFQSLSYINMQTGKKTRCRNEKISAPCFYLIEYLSIFRSVNIERCRNIAGAQKLGDFLFVEVYMSELCV